MAAIVSRSQDRWASAVKTVNYGHPLANGLVFAAVPGPSGAYYDATRYRNHAIPSAGNPTLETVNGGPAYLFSASSSLGTVNATTPAMSAARGFSWAAWVRIPGLFTSEYGSLFGRVGSEDWQILADGSNRRFAYARSGALLANSVAIGNGAGWVLWHFSLQPTGAFNWWVSGDGVGGLVQANNSGSGAPFRSASGRLFISSQDGSTGKQTCAIGRVYIWNKALTIDEHRRLALDEWGLLSSPKRYLWSVDGAAAAFKPAWARRSSQIIGGG
jgi:hypothetical protein